jgi:hypothetical protein
MYTSAGLFCPTYFYDHPKTYALFIFLLSSWIFSFMPAYTNYQDQELVALLQQDDARAFTELYNRHWKSLYYTAVSILQNQEASRDIVQDVFTSPWQRRGEVGIEYPKTYLQQVTRF